MSLHNCIKKKLAGHCQMSPQLCIYHRTMTMQGWLCQFEHQGLLSVENMQQRQVHMVVTLHELKCR